MLNFQSFKERIIQNNHTLLTENLCCTNTQDLFLDPAWAKISIILNKTIIHARSFIDHQHLFFALCTITNCVFSLLHTLTSYFEIQVFLCSIKLTIQTHPNLSKCSKHIPNLFQTYPNLSKPIQPFEPIPNLSKLFQAYPKHIIQNISIS